MVQRSRSTLEHSGSSLDALIIYAQFQVPDSQWTCLELATAAFVSPLPLEATTNLQASASENPTAATATEPILALPVVDSLPAATAEFNASLAGSGAGLLCAPEVTPLQVCSRPFSLSFHRLAVQRVIAMCTKMSIEKI